MNRRHRQRYERVNSGAVSSTTDHPNAYNRILSAQVAATPTSIYF